VSSRAAPTVSELRDAVGGITPKVLTQTLRGMEHDGLVERKVYAEVPPRVEYSLTELGRTMLEPIEAIRAWAVRNMEHFVAHMRAEDSTPERPGGSQPLVAVFAAVSRAAVSRAAVIRAAVSRAAVSRAAVQPSASPPRGRGTRLA
jgi:DNA-binding HxlR family transcriptional regulator